MNEVFIVEHSYERGECDETKLIGVYSTRENAELAVERLKMQPGFRDRPDDFFIERYELNQDHWTQGYSTMTTIYVKAKDDAWMTVQAEMKPDGTYQILELQDNELPGEFKHLDIVECEERDGMLFATRISGTFLD